MAVKASASVTLSRVVDVSGVTRYYQLVASTASAPAKPTTNPPASAWTSKEPGYDGTTTSTLYFTDQTVLSDGTFSYSDVSKSSSYEAAKQAYNKAAAAQTTANSSLANVTVEYAVGTSATTAPTSGWSSATPTWESGKYVWQRTGTKANSASAYTYTYACIQGAKGDKGDTGAGFQWNLLHYTNRYDFTGAFTGIDVAAGTTGVTKSTPIAYTSDGNAYILASWYKVYTGYKEAQFVDKTDSWTNDVSQYGIAVGDKLAYRVKASDTGKCCYELLTITDITGSKVTGTATFSDLADATWGWRSYTYTAPSSWFYAEIYDNYGTMKEVCDNGADYYTVSMKMRSNVAMKSSPLRGLRILQENSLNMAYSNASSTGSLTAGEWCDVSATVKRVASAAYTSQVIYFQPSALFAAGATMEIKDVKLEEGTTATPWCTTQAETIGAKGDKGEQGIQGIQGVQGAKGDTGASVTEVAVTYGLSTSNASDGYSSVTSWTTDIPDWTSGKYIWQKSVTTIGTTAQAPVYALYGAFNSLASTVDGHTTQLKQDGKSITAIISTQNTQTEAVSNLQDGVSGNTSALANMQTWLQVNADGLTMGKSDSPYISKMDNEKLGFYAHSSTGDTELASFGANGMDIPSASIDQLTVEPYIMTVRNGHLLIQYGGE